MVVSSHPVTVIDLEYDPLIHTISISTDNGRRLLLTGSSMQMKVDRDQKLVGLRLCVQEPYVRSVQLELIGLVKDLIDTKRRHD